MIRRYVYDPNEWAPDGLSCMDCDRVIEAGEEIADDLKGMVGEFPLSEVVCGVCATKREDSES